MGVPDQDDNSAGKKHDRFSTTQWSVVLAAGREGSPSSERAMAALCETYWYPIYAFIRRRGHSAIEAEDLTQGFFERLLEKGYVSDADPSRGRFRSFLMATVKNYLSKERDKAKAQKRGGGRVPISLDGQAAEVRFNLEPADHFTPEARYEREWALAILENTLKDLEDWYAARNDQQSFESLKQYLEGRSQSYCEVASTLGVSEAAVKKKVERLRARFDKLLENQLSQTVSDPEDIAEERRWLRSVMKF